MPKKAALSEVSIIPHNELLIIEIRLKMNCLMADRQPSSAKRPRYLDEFRPEFAEKLLKVKTIASSNWPMDAEKTFTGPF